MQIIEMAVKDLKPYEKNPRLNDDAVKYVAESIRNFGFKVPIVIDKDNNIVCGHTRWKACKKLKIDTVPCVVADDLTEEQIRAYRLADNRVAEKAEWDLELLDTELAEIETIDMTLLGFDDKEEQTPQEVVEDDFDEEPPAEPIAKYGDLYQLGRHKLLCGDSTKIDDVEKLMDGCKANMVFADPPYGMKKENEGVANDNLNFDDLLAFNKEWIPLSFSALKENGSWYCWGIDEPLMDIYAEILKPMQKENKITFRNLLTWDKKDAGAGGVSFMGKDGLRSYPVGSEKCLFVMCGVNGSSNNADNYFEAWEPIRIYLKQERDRMGWSNADMKKMVGHSPTSGCHWFDKSQWMMPTEEEYKTWQRCANGNGFKKQYEEIKKQWYETRAYFDNTHDTMRDVWDFGRISHEEKAKAGGHATPKPIILCSRAIKSSSREDEIVLDLFGGGGSTLIACEQLNRTCYMMELEPQWVDVIINRWETFTGQKAVKLNAD